MLRPNTLDIHLRDLIHFYADVNINGPYEFERWAGLFFIDLAEFQIEFKQDDQYLSTLASLAKLTTIHKDKASG